MSKQNENPGCAAFGALGGLILAIFMFGPCNKNTPTRWTNYGDGSYETWQQTNTPEKAVNWKMEKLMNNENY